MAVRRNDRTRAVPAKICALRRVAGHPLAKATSPVDVGTEDEDEDEVSDE